MTSTRYSHKQRSSGEFRHMLGWELKHNRIFTLFYAFFLIGSMAGGTLLSILGNLEYYTNMSNWEGCTVAEVTEYFARTVAQTYNAILTISVLPISIFFIFIYCHNIFGYMHSRRSVDLYHAIPVRRIPLLMGGYVSGLVSLILPLAVSTALTHVVCAAYHLPYPLTPALFWQGFGLMALMLTACFTFTTFFMVTSGTLVDAYVSLVSTALGWPLLCWMADTAMSLFLPGYVSSMTNGFITLLCPYAAAILAFRNVEFYDSSVLPFSGVSLVFILWWVVFTLFLLGATIVYYVRRKSEYAENNFSFPLIRNLTRFLISASSGLAIAYILSQTFEGNVIYLVGVVLGSLVAHVVLQVVWARGFRKFWKAIPTYALTLAVLGGFLFLLYEGGLGYVQRVPDPADVTMVEFSAPYNTRDGSMESYLAQYSGTYLLNQQDDYVGSISPYFTDTEDIAAICNLHQQIVSKYAGPCLPYRGEESGIYDSFSVTYTLKNGGTLTRYYTLRVTEEETGLIDAIAQLQKLDTYKLYEPFYYVDSPSINSVQMWSYTEESEYSANNYELSEEEQEQVWTTFVEELTSKDFTYPTDWSEADYSNDIDIYDAYYEDDVYTPQTSSDVSYQIEASEIEYDDLPENVQKLIETYLQDHPNAWWSDEYSSPTDPKLPAKVGSTSYTVPECCTKTRALIDQLTEPYGETYNYNEE